MEISAFLLSTQWNSKEHGNFQFLGRQTEPFFMLLYEKYILYLSNVSYSFPIYINFGKIEQN